MITIKNVKAADQDNAINTIKMAFSADPAARWMYPDSQQYWEHFQSFVKAFAGAAFEHGSADWWMATWPRRFGFLPAFIRMK
jgi:hypothetical protein